MLATGLSQTCGSFSSLSTAGLSTRSTRTSGRVIVEIRIDSKVLRHKYCINGVDVALISWEQNLSRPSAWGP